MRVLWLLLLIPALRADELTQKMMARVSEEADAFQKLAPQVLAQETLHQRGMKPPKRFRPRIGNAATTPPPVEWQERTVVSEYGFSSFAGEHDTLHELRQVISVDGRKVADTKKAQDALAKVITASDDARKREVLKQFEKYGLIGAITDYGQALLLFTRRGMERCEFTAKGSNWLKGERVLVFGYRQIDGSEGLTLIDESKGNRIHRLRLEGEIWVRSDNYVPVRITVIAADRPPQTEVREEAAVDYAMSPFGALLPSQVEHREVRAGKTTAENQLTYSEFHKFGASSDIKFEVEK